MKDDERILHPRGKDIKALQRAEYSITEREFDSLTEAYDYLYKNMGAYEAEQLRHFCPVTGSRCRPDCEAFGRARVVNVGGDGGNNKPCYFVMDAFCAYRKRFTNWVKDKG